MNIQKELIREEKNTFLGKSVLSSKEAQVYLDISASLLDTLCATRVIKHYKPNSVNKRKEIVEGRKRYFRVKDLDNWLMTNLKEVI
jgi:hypothetical protein